jgi:exosortase/archaeosortase family protein
MAVRTSSTILRIPGAALDIRFGCNGLEAMLIYSIALLAFPAPWIKRVTGILAGFVIMQALNIVRIIALAFVRVHYPGFFELFHIYIAQGILIAVALVLFIAWIGYAQKGV